MYLITNIRRKDAILSQACEIKDENGVMICKIYSVFHDENSSPSKYLFNVYVPSGEIDEDRMSLTFIGGVDSIEDGIDMAQRLQNSSIFRIMEA
jgi:hypothetical protein